MLIRFLHITIEQVCYYTRIEYKIEEKITSASRSSKVLGGRSLATSEYIVFIPREENRRKKKIFVCVTIDSPDNVYMCSLQAKATEAAAR
jgi:hypothetical protein